jgi:hypothetical protein
MPRHPVVELEHDQPVVRDFPACDLHIHDIEEAWFRPPAFFPVGDEFLVTKEIHWRLDGEADGTEGELELLCGSWQGCGRGRPARSAATLARRISSRCCTSGSVIELNFEKARSNATPVTSDRVWEPQQFNASKATITNCVSWLRFRVSFRSLRSAAFELLPP